MSKQYPGGIISKTGVVANSVSASGVWTLNQQAAAQATNSWPFVRDPYFNNVTLLLNGDGSSTVNNGLGAGVTPVVTPFNSDASTNNFNVTINGDARSNNFTPYQGTGYYSAYFDGSGDYISAGSSITLTGDFTVEGWVYPISTSGSGCIILGLGNNYYSTSATFFISTAGNIRVYTGQAHLLAGSTLVPFNTWSHVAFVRSSNTLRVYLNGVQVDTASWSASLSGTAFINNEQNGFPTVNTYPGSSNYMSNIRVNTTAVYTSAFTPSTTPLTAITGTQLLACQSNSFVDKSTNNYTITRVGDSAIASAQPFTLPSNIATYGSGYFDGTGDYLTAASNAAFTYGTGNFTIEGWHYLTAASSVTKYLFDQRVSGNGYLPALYVSGGQYIVYINTAIPLTAGTVISNAWVHWALVKNSSTTTLYINGVSVGSFSDTNNYSVTAQFRVGSEWNSSGSYDWQGYMNDVRVVKGTAVYTSAFTPPTAPLTAIANTSLLTVQYNGAGNNSGFKDNSTNNFTITRNGNTTQGTFTPYGSNWSNYFDGSGDYLTFPNNAALSFGTGDFTIEAWVYKTSASNASIIDGRASNSASPWAFYVDASNFPYFYTGTSYTSTTAITLNSWNHVAVTRSSGTLKIFVNGVQGYSATVTTNLDRSSGSQVIGADVTGTTAYWNGYISNLRVVKGSAVYTSAFTPPTSPLTAITNTSLLTCADNRFMDDSTNNFTITKNGDTSVQRFSPFSPTTAYSTSVIGGSGYFDGTGDQLTVANNSAFDVGSGNFTVEAWVYLTSTSGSVFNYSNGQTQNSNFAWEIYQLSATSIQVSVFNNNTQYTASSTSLVANAWNHVAAVRNGNTLTIYVNGVAGGTTASVTGVTVNNPASSTVKVSGYNNSTNNITGYVTDARMVKGTAVYTANFTPPTAPLTAITNTQLLTNFTNAGILDNAMMNDLETVGNAQISTSVKKYGTGSMYFDGTGDYLFRPSSPLYDFGTGDFTLEMWVYRNGSQTAYAGLVGFSVDSGNGLILGFGNADNKLRVVWNNAQTILASTAMTNTTWTHVALVRSGATVTCYQDGTSVGTSNISTSAMPFTGAGMVIGRLVTNTDNYYFNGYIDDLRITKGVARYTANFTAPTAAFKLG